MTTRARGWLVLVALVLVALSAAIAACTINPQPLPPGADEENRAVDDSGGFGAQDGSATGTESPPADAASTDGKVPLGDSGDEGDGGADSGDAGDASDADAGDGG